MRWASILPTRRLPDSSVRGYGRFRFKEEKVNKWNCVYRLRDPMGVAPDDYRFRMFVAVGTREDAKATLAALAEEFTGR